MWSEKEIAVTATFIAKAGFDLKERFDIRIDDDLVTVTMPRAKVLSVEPTSGFKIESASGSWNWVTDEDRSGITEELIAAARQSAENGNVVQAARSNLRETMETIVKSRMGKDVRIIYREG